MTAIQSQIDSTSLQCNANTRHWGKACLYSDSAGRVPSRYEISPLLFSPLSWQFPRGLPLTPDPAQCMGSCLTAPAWSLHGGLSSNRLRLVPNRRKMETRPAVNRNLYPGGRGSQQEVTRLHRARTGNLRAAVYYITRQKIYRRLFEIIIFGKCRYNLIFFWCLLIQNFSAFDFAHS